MRISKNCSIYVFQDLFQSYPFLKRVFEITFNRLMTNKAIFIKYSTKINAYLKNALRGQCTDI